jgi:hypothetical protein
MVGMFQGFVLSLIENLILNANSIPQLECRYGYEQISRSRESRTVTIWFRSDVTHSILRSGFRLLRYRRRSTHPCLPGSQSSRCGHSHCRVAGFCASVLVVLVSSKEAELVAGVSPVAIVDRVEPLVLDHARTLSGSRLFYLLAPASCTTLIRRFG